jgi:hypothetical protein
MENPTPDTSRLKPEDIDFTAPDSLAGADIEAAASAGEHQKNLQTKAPGTVLGGHGAVISSFEQRKGAGPDLEANKAFHILEVINTQYQGEPFNIPTEEYKPYLEAAKLYVAFIERIAAISEPGYAQTNKTYRLAKDVIRKVPKESLAA